MLALVACEGGESGGDAIQQRELAAVTGSGVAECDAYLTAYETCINSVVPTASRPTALQGLHKSRNAWALVTTNTDKLALARMCTKAQQTLSENSCTWSATGTGTGGSSGSGGSSSGGSASGGTAGSGGSGGTCTVQNAQQITTNPGVQITLAGNACFKINQASWNASKIKLQAMENGNPPTYPYPMDFTWFQASGSGCTTNGTPASAQLTANWNEKVLPPSTNLAASCPLVVKFSEAASPTFKFTYFYQ